MSPGAIRIPGNWQEFAKSKFQGFALIENPGKQYESIWQGCPKCRDIFLEEHKDPVLYALEMYPLGDNRCFAHPKFKLRKWLVTDPNLVLDLKKHYCTEFNASGFCVTCGKSIYDSISKGAELARSLGDGK